MAFTCDIGINRKKGLNFAAVKAVIFDFIGTLTHLKEFNVEKSKLKLYKSLVNSGFNMSETDFLKAYDEFYEESRLKRYRELVEVTDAVWVAQALNRLGFKTDPGDLRIKTAVAVFFQDYFDALELNECAGQFLKRISKQYRIGLVSNFTYAPVIYAALRKLRINKFFKAILVSQEVGYRKPNKEIFQEALRRLDVDAEETVYIGDCPAEDIGGAGVMGMRTIFLPSQFYSHEDLVKSKEKPDLTVENMCELHRIFAKFIENM